LKGSFFFERKLTLSEFSPKKGLTGHQIHLVCERLQFP
jgi:hypothetical protein